MTVGRSFSADAVTTTVVAQGFRRLMVPLLPWASFALVLLCFQQFRDSTAQAIAMAGLSAPLLLSFAIWSDRAGDCLPVLPLLQLSNFMVFGLSVLLFDSQQLPDPLLDLVNLPLMLWPSMILLGWFLVPSGWLRQRFQPPMLGAADGAAFLPHILVGGSLLIQLLLDSGFVWDLLGDAAKGLINPLQTLMTLMLLPGAFVGAFRWARNRLKEPAVFWSLVIVYFCLILLSFLLSAAQNLVIASLLGLWLGRSRYAWVITLSLVLLLVFLHPGKGAMRAKYWGTGVPRPSPPELLVEWVGTSYNAAFTPQVSKESEGLDKRLANLAMLIFVSVQQQRGVPALDGATYAIIPEVILPRFLNPNKIRSQEGQVLLNLHYGRQGSRKDTERTYISWGLLPESVGNYGPLVGPLVVGLCLGALVRMVELVGWGQDLLSKPGLESLVLGVLFIGSYEMVASTFSAACVQSILMIEALNLYLRQKR